VNPKKIRLLSQRTKEDHTVTVQKERMDAISLHAKTDDCLNIAKNKKVFLQKMLTQKMYLFISAVLLKLIVEISSFENKLKAET
jgi:hypothetical protein